MKKFNPVVPNFPHMLHGGDYNPDQWKAFPEIISDDFKYFDKANVNTVSIGIFSWVEFEPEDGVYNFEFFDKIMDNLAAQGMKACLATPSAGKPHWLGIKYPDILPVNEAGVRGRRGGRGGFCKSSPDFRRKIHDLNTAMAEHYKDHPALGMWHISNECCGECYCERCQNNFREWLKKKYKTLDAINAAYWNSFWGHTYTDWSEIVVTDKSVHALILDWKRYVNDLLADYIAWEAAALKKVTPDVPVTTNMMETDGIDYKKVAKVVDVVSWDSYPRWHALGDAHMYSGIKTAFWHDRFRSMGKKPFMLMECAPTFNSWLEVNKGKKPGMHKLASMQAIAHGSESVQYFQWRKSRGGFEKFHGAVVDHCGRDDTRVFKEVSEVGAALAKLDEVVGTMNVSRVAIIYDIENAWALNEMAGARKPKKYEDLCLKFYKPLWKKGISCDVIEACDELDSYDLVIVPALYMADDAACERIAKFVENGGTLLSTYFTGWVDENDLCRLGGFPGGKLAEVFGVWSEDLECLHNGEKNTARMIKSVDGLKDSYEIIEYCDLLHTKNDDVEVLAEFADDYYAGMPALTVNKYGKGKAYYMGFKNEGDFMADILGKLTDELGIKGAADIELPENAAITMRTDGENDYLFVQNYNSNDINITLDGEYFDMLEDKTVSGTLTIDKYGIRILKRSAK